MRGRGAFRPLRSPLWGEQVILYVGPDDRANHATSRACRTLKSPESRGSLGEGRRQPVRRSASGAPIGPRDRACAPAACPSPFGDGTVLGDSLHRVTPKPGDMTRWQPPPVSRQREGARRRAAANDARPRTRAWGENPGEGLDAREGFCHRERSWAMWAYLPCETRGITRGPGVAVALFQHQGGLCPQRTR